ncbi:ABC transporter permease [Leifsonia poae]|uniref:ABC transporter substrate-binding protein n=1 Tax=Leifsonia poae TaxID=110933 RepID=A0A9W6H992_9MICO|nr:FtsX-like permease family protein [Leifsonia poae]GLJ76251.1 ABC transporter substrate-binding protein [Leifsonia poae]
MFVAWRDLRFARGRFILIGSVVALITLLVGFLSGLTGGLAAQNVSAVLALPGDRLVFSEPPAGETASGASFSDSAITEAQADAWSTASGVTASVPIGISQTRAQSEGTQTAVSIFGVGAGFGADAPSEDGRLVLSEGAASGLSASAGDTVTIAGVDYTVASVRGDGWYSHTPVVFMTLHDWQRYSAATGSAGAFATVLSVTGDPDWSAVDANEHTISQTPLGSLTAIGSFRSEIGSLLLMVALLFGISALVIGAFFTVWTMQRTGDIAVLKALGASTRSLVRDALGQALVVLVIGVGVGTGVVAALGMLAGTALPFILSPFTTLLPAVLLIALGLAGAAFALRSVTSADPLTALGSNR